MKSFYVPSSLFRALGVSLLMLILVGCHEDPISRADGGDEDALLQAEASAFALDPAAPSKQALSHLYTRATRREGTGGIAHYQFNVRLGPGPFDVVRLHRVMREPKRFHPVRTNGAVFMVPGSPRTLVSF